MSINEIPRRRTPAPAPTESIFSNALGAPPKKRKRQAENITEDYLLKRLEKQRGMEDPVSERKAKHTLKAYEELYKRNREDF